MILIHNMEAKNPLDVYFPTKTIVICQHGQGNAVTDVQSKFGLDE